MKMCAGPRHWPAYHVMISAARVHWGEGDPQLFLRAPENGHSRWLCFLWLRVQPTSLDSSTGHWLFSMHFPLYKTRPSGQKQPGEQAPAIVTLLACEHRGILAGPHVRNSIPAGHLLSHDFPGK